MKLLKDPRLKRSQCKLHLSGTGTGKLTFLCLAMHELYQAWDLSVVIQMENLNALVLFSKMMCLGHHNYHLIVITPVPDNRHKNRP